MNIRTFVAIFSRNPQYNFPKMRGRVKGRLELFIHPIWKRGAPLIIIITFNNMYICHFHYF